MLSGVDADRLRDMNTVMSDLHVRLDDVLVWFRSGWLLSLVVALGSLTVV